MPSSEIFTGVVFNTEKNLKLGKLVSATTKPHYTMRGAIWGYNKINKNIIVLKSLN